MDQWFRFFEDNGQQKQIKVGKAVGGGSGAVPAASSAASTVADASAAPALEIEVYSGGSILSPGASEGRRVSAQKVQILAPVVPSKMLCLWNNFHEMAAKIGQPIPPEPLYFVKSPNSFANPGDAVRKPASYEGKVVYEGELGIVIGKVCKDLPESEAEAAIFGFTCVNDVTALDIINRDPTFQQWARAKSCDTFGPFGPTVATGLDWRSARVRTIVGGRERQNYPVADMVFSPPQIVSLLSRELTLYPGDIISCGTSLGVLPMRPNTVMEVVIDGVGSLINTYEPTEDQA
jgi:2-keto-4-pentenoate hydratase/2-oxohepta-3-ene-1,7-dioic acid hydratase in catechol pathway